MHSYKPGDEVRLQSATTRMRVSEIQAELEMISTGLVFCVHNRKSFKEVGLYKASALKKL